VRTVNIWPSFVLVTMEPRTIFGTIALVTAVLGIVSNKERIRHRRKRRRGIKVTVIGDISCDVIADKVESLPSWDDEEYVPTPMSIQGGGSALNTASWLHSLSHNLHVSIPQTFSRRKSDVFTDCIVRTIEKAGLYLVPPTSASVHCESRDLSDRLSCEVERDRLNWDTGTSLCLGSADRRCFVSYRGGNGLFQLTDFEFTSLVPSGTQHIHFAGFYNCPGLWAEGHVEAFIRACRRDRAVRTVSLNPQHSLNWERIKTVIPLVDFFICNRFEALGISGEPDLLDAVMTLAQKFECNCVVVTMGADGALLMRRCIDIRPIRVLCKDTLEHPIVDTVGVGDAFCAGFLHEVITKSLSPESNDIIEAVRFGCASGTAACYVSGGTTFPGNHTVRECLID
jgi:sugar/nucleoside kinase (ribokinase family)